MFQKLKKIVIAAATGVLLTATVTAGAFAANVTASTSVNVRAGAGNDYSVVTVLKKGQSVTSLGTSGNWTKISANGKTGYVYSSYLSSGGSAASYATKKTTASTPSDDSDSSGNSSNSSSDMTYMGNFKLTFYAGDTETASGRSPQVNHTIAADTSLLPMYSTVYIEGWGTYVVEDRGSAIKNKRIDIFVESEAVANRYGVKYADVYLVN